MKGFENSYSPQEVLYNKALSSFFVGLDVDSIQLLFQSMKDVSSLPYDIKDQRCWHYADNLAAKLEKILENTGFEVSIVSFQNIEWNDGTKGEKLNSHAFVTIESKSLEKGLLLEPQTMKELPAEYNLDRSSSDNKYKALEDSWIFKRHNGIKDYKVLTLSASVRSTKNP